MYGDLLDKYPVVAGSVWRFENGTLICGSALHEASWAHIPKVSCVYTDPPWNDGNMKMFYRFAKQEVETSHLEFAVELFRRICTKTTVNSTVCFDMGIKATAPLIERLKEFGWVNMYVFRTFYGTPPRPLNTICGTFYSNLIGSSIVDIQGKHGTDVISGVVKAFIEAGHRSMLDPCCGKLDFLVEGLKQGIDNVYGIELIPEKLALGLERLEKLGYVVKRIA